VNSYIANIDLPTLKTQDFWDKIPSQRQLIQRLLSDGAISFYALSDDLNRLWVIINANSEWEAKNVIGQFPIIRYINVKIIPLRFVEQKMVKFPYLYLN
jgi:hypothetical protein